MSTSEFDLAIDGLSKQADLSPFDKAISSLPDAGHSAALRDAANQAVKIAPDTAAETRSLAQSTSTPIDVVGRNMEAVKVQAKAGSVPYEAIIKQNPKLAEWLTNSNNAAMVQDDLPAMGFLDSLLQKVADYARAPVSGVLQGLGSAAGGVADLANLAERHLDIVAPELNNVRNVLLGMPLPDSVKAAISAPEPLPAYGKGQPWWSGPTYALQAAGAMAEKAGAALEVPRDRQGLVTEVLSGLGQFAPLIAASLMGAPEVATGMFIGQGAGDMKDAVSEDNAPQYKKDLAVLAGAGIAVGTGEFGLNMLLKRVPFPIKNAIVSKLADLAAAGGIQAVQQGMQSLLNDVTRHVLTNPSAPIGEGLTASGSGASFATGAAARAILTMFGVPAETHFKEQQAALQETHAAVAASKLAERSPDGLRDYIANVTKDSAHENAHLPVDTFREYFQSRGVDPAQAAEEITPGGAELYRKANESGSDLTVPYADYETKLAPEHAAFFDKELKFNPSDMNFNEATKWMADEAARADESAPDVKAQDAKEKIKQDIIGQISGQFDPVAADANADSVAKVFATIGERAGVDPFELYSKYKLNVKFPLPEILKSKDSVDSLDTMLERIRKGDIPQAKDLFGPSMVEWLRANGGVKDVGGDISSREPDKGLRPFQRNLIQPETGMPLDTAVLRLREEGYIPETANINEMIDMVDNELRGEPVYSQHRADTPEAQRADALYQLDNYLKDRGVDLAALSNDEVRKILTDASEMTNKAGDTEFFQKGGGSDKRGSLVFNKDGSFNLNLFAKRNLSTFLHETGHFYLEVFGDVVDQLKAMDPESLNPVQQIMVDDYGKALKFLEVNDRAGIGEDQHEKWARSIEAYLREGKAPAIELRPMFARFRSWLLDLYRTARGLNVELNPEIREVMDRLYATDQEIEAAQHEAEVRQIFMTQQESGLDDHGWKAYQDTIQKASDQAKDTLQSKLMKEFARERQQWWMSESDKLRGEIASQVHQQPEYIALSALKRGELPDGSESTYGEKLDLNAIKQRFGKDTTVTERIRKLGVARLDGGVDPDVAARAFGFSSGEDLVHAIANARPMNELIEAETHDEMIRRHGDIRLDGSIHDEAQRAVYGKYRDAVVRMEMAALRAKQRAGRPAERAEADRQKAERDYERRWLEAEKNLAVATEQGRSQEIIDSLKAASAKIKADQKAAAREFAGALKPGDGVIPTPEQITRFAEDILKSATIKEVLPGKFWTAARKASREGLAFAGKDLFDDALLAKRRELLNLELYRQANDLKDSFDKTRTDWLKMFKSDAKVSVHRSMEMVTAARAIASRYLFPDKQGRVNEALDALKAYSPELHENVVDALPEIMNDSRLLKDLSVEEFNGVRDIVAGLWELAKTSKQIVVDGKRFDAEGVRDDLRSRMVTFKGGWNKFRAEHGGHTWAESALGKVAILRRMESWVTAMDGGDSGPFRSYVWDVLNNADAVYRDARLTRLERMDKIIDPIRHTLTLAKIEAPEIGYTFKSKGELLGFLSHTGNKEGPTSNYFKLVRGGRGPESNWGAMREDGTLDDSKVRAMLDRMQKDHTLVKADYDAVQGLWDLFEELKPGLQGAHKEINGYYFKEIQATPFSTPWGDYRGGYVPAKADPILSDDAGIQELKNAIGESGNSFTLPSAGGGATKSRVGIARPLELGLSYVPSHIDWALRYTHLEPRVNDVYRLLNDRSFRSQMRDVEPQMMQKAIIPWLRRVATQRISEVGLHQGALDSTWSKLSSGAAINSLTLSVTNTLHQLVGLPVSLTHVSAPRLTTAVARMMISPRQMFEQAKENSAYMRQTESTRANELLQDYRQSLKVSGPVSKVTDAVRQHGMIMQRIMAGFVNTAVWHAAYDQAQIDRRSPDKSVLRADSVVRQTQHARRPIDVAAYESGTPFVRAMTMFSGWFNNIANNQLSQVGNALRADKPLYDRVGRAVSAYVFGAMVPAIMAQSILNTVHGKWKEDDETDLHAALMLFFGSQVQMGSAMIPGFGQAANVGFNAIFEKNSYGDDVRTSPVISLTEEFAKSLHSMTRPDQYGSYAVSGKEISDTLKFVGMLGGVPLGPVGNPIKFLTDVSNGKVRPRGAGDYARGLITGSIPKE